MLNKILNIVLFAGMVVGFTLFGWVKCTSDRQNAQLQAEIVQLREALQETTIIYDTSQHIADTSFHLTPSDSLLIFKLIARKQPVVVTPAGTYIDTNYVTVYDTLPVMRRFYPGVYSTRHFKLPYVVSVDGGTLNQIQFKSYELYEQKLHTRSTVNTPVMVKDYRSAMFLYGSIGNDTKGWLSWKTAGAGLIYTHKRGLMLGVGGLFVAGDKNIPGRGYIEIRGGYRITR